MIAYLQTFDWGVEFVDKNVGEPMDSMSSKLYAKRGIKSGDTIYLAYIDDRRRLNLVSRLQVESMAPGRRGEEDIVDAERGTSTPMVLGRVVPRRTARQLRFLVRKGWKLGEPIYYSKNTALTFEADGRLRSQTARTIRRLNSRSGSLLEEIIQTTG